MKLAAIRYEYDKLVEKHRRDGDRLTSIQHILNIATAELETLRRDELIISHK